MADEICAVCGESGSDRRTLKLRYFYDLAEISHKFSKEQIHYMDGSDNEDTLFTLRTCKECRGDFLALLRRWINGEFVPKETNSEANIPVRQDGRTVMVTRAVWDAMKRGKHDRA